MADIIIHQIQNRTKVEVMIGLALMSLITLLGEKIWVGEPIPIEIFWGLGILLVSYIAMILLTYLRYYIEKMIYLKEQEVLANIQSQSLTKEIRKLELMKEIKDIEATSVG